MGTRSRLAPHARPRTLPRPPQSPSSPISFARFSGLEPPALDILTVACTPRMPMYICAGGRGGQQREGGGGGGGGAPQRGHDQVVVEGLESHELSLADMGSLRSACGGQEGRRSGCRGASTQVGWACEMGGACSGGLLRVRMRAADLAPLAGVASARETGRNLGRCQHSGPCNRLVVVDLQGEHLLSISAQKPK